MALADRRHANVLLVRLQGDHIQRFRHLQFGFQKELGKDVPHLLQPQACFTASLFTRVGEKGKMGGAYSDPLGF